MIDLNSTLLNCKVRLRNGITGTMKTKKELNDKDIPFAVYEVEIELDSPQSLFDENTIEQTLIARYNSSGLRNPFGETKYDIVSLEKPKITVNSESFGAF